MKIEAIGKVIDNKIKVDRDHLINFHRDIGHLEGKDIVITVKRKTTRRSNQQNKYYWAVIVNLFREGMRDIGTPLTIDQTHDLLKFRFLVDEIVNEKTGLIIPRTKSTTELSTTEFMNFKDDVQRWAAEMLHINIPDPNETIYAY